MGQPEIRGASHVPFHSFLSHIERRREANSPHGASYHLFQCPWRHITRRREFRVDGFRQTAAHGDAPEAVQAGPWCGKRRYRPMAHTKHRHSAHKNDSRAAVWRNGAETRIPVGVPGPFTDKTSRFTDFISRYGCGWVLLLPESKPQTT